MRSMIKKNELWKVEVEVEISWEYEHIGRMYELMKKGVYVEWFVKNDIDKTLIRINSLKDILREKLSVEETA